MIVNSTACAEPLTIIPMANPIRFAEDKFPTPCPTLRATKEPFVCAFHTSPRPDHCGARRPERTRSRSFVAGGERSLQQKLRPRKNDRAARRS